MVHYQQLLDFLKNDELDLFTQAFYAKFVVPPEDTLACLSFIQHIPEGQTTALRLMLSHLKHYHHQKGYQSSIVAPESRVLITKILFCLKPGWINNPHMAAKTLNICFEHYLEAQTWTPEQWGQWGQLFVADAAAKKISLDQFCQITRYVEEKYPAFLNSELYSLDKPIEYRNYALIEILLQRQWAMPQSGVYLLKKLLEAGSPQKSLKQAEVGFLVKLAKDFRGKKICEEEQQLFLDLMTHPHYSLVLGDWLCAMKPKYALVCQKLGLNKMTDRIIKHYLCVRALKLLPGLREEGLQQWHILQNIISLYTQTKEEALCLHQRLLRSGWLALVNPETGMTPPEEFIAQASFISFPHEIKNWLAVGYPLQIPGRKSLVEQAMDAGNPRLAQSLLKYAKDNHLLPAPQKVPVLYSTAKTRAKKVRFNLAEERALQRSRPKSWV